MHTLYNDIYAWGEGTVIHLEIHSPVINPAVLHGLSQAQYYTLVATENIFDGASSISKDGGFILPRIGREFNIPVERMVFIAHYPDTLIGLERFPLIYNLISLDDAQVAQFHPLLPQEVPLLKSGKQISYRADASLGYSFLYEKYKRYI